MFAANAPIHQFVDGFNSGNEKSALAAFVTAGVAIIDDGPPYVWTLRPLTAKPTSPAVK